MIGAELSLLLLLGVGPSALVADDAGVVELPRLSWFGTESQAPDEGGPANPASEPPAPNPGPVPMMGPQPLTAPGGDLPPPPSQAPVNPNASAVATGEEPAADEDLSLDDIFGTSEDHADVTSIDEAQAKGDVASVGPAAVAPKSRKQKFLDALDLRFRVVSSLHFDIDRVDERRFSRNENRLEFYFSYTPNKHLQIVGDIEPVFQGVSQVQALNDVATRQNVTPFHFESDAAYVALLDVLPNLDIKIGRQIVVWGSADRFNPTNNINPDDLEERPVFTEPIANQMVVVDYAPLADRLWFQAVYVPIFYPALLPPSAAAGLTDPQSPVPFAYRSDRNKVGELQDLLALESGAGLIPEVTGDVIMPANRFVDGQSAFKLGTSLGGVDLSFSYYNGRHDIPLPLRALSSAKAAEERGEENTPECCFRSDVELAYPRMQVVGFDFSTQLPFLGNMGLWGEGALFIPKPYDFYIEFPIPIDVTPDDGVANPVEFLEGPSVRDTPFIKATAGFDYTFGKHVYVQAQYLRGFIDDFGVDHIGNYLVGGTELVFFGRHLIFRAFGVVDLPRDSDDEGSYVIYPEIILVPPWGSVTLELGSFFLLGGRRTKFGQSGAGSSIAFFKVSAAF